MTDHVMNHAPALFQQQFPHMDSLQDVLVMTAGTAIITPDQEFIQILNIDQNHWVTVSNIAAAKA